MKPISRYRVLDGVWNSYFLLRYERRTNYEETGQQLYYRPFTNRTSSSPDLWSFPTSSASSSTIHRPTPSACSSEVPPQAASCSRFRLPDKWKVKSFIENNASQLKSWSRSHGYFSSRFSPQLIRPLSYRLGCVSEQKSATVKANISSI